MEYFRKEEKKGGCTTYSAASFSISSRGDPSTGILWRIATAHRIAAANDTTLSRLIPLVRISIGKISSRAGKIVTRRTSTVVWPALSPRLQHEACDFRFFFFPRRIQLSFGKIGKKKSSATEHKVRSLSVGERGLCYGRDPGGGVGGARRGVLGFSLAGGGSRDPRLVRFLGERE
ncbi:hypothetical protein CDAR_603671 [Caerostris darwini]|uniref:Uncharacterized protein n=1 Tax=Caerostris darwini TaxID=1538125 RepID=A0AAV4T8A3_9ARAC|nr:hypothetical protein CDAR_603671 [Caerostris darwini]